MLTLIVGTNRPGSNTRRIATLIEGIYRELKVPLEVLDLKDLPLDLFRPEAFAAKPPGFARFAESVLRSDGLIVVSPEYNGGAPGILKHFIDMLKFPESFDRRPVAFVGLSAGQWGALRPVEQLQQIFGYRNAHIYPERVFLAAVHTRLDEAGQLKDPEDLQRLRKQAEGFARFAEQLRGAAISPAQ